MCIRDSSSEKLGRDYSVMELADFTHAELLPIYQRRGYLRATFSHPQTEPASSPENAVTVRLDVEEGRCYSLQEIRWEGNTALDSAKLQTLVHLKAGEPANLVQLKSDMNSVHALSLIHISSRRTVTAFSGEEAGSVCGWEKVARR